MGNTVQRYVRKNGRCPTIEALTEFRGVSQELLDAAEQGILELRSCTTFSRTLVKKIDKNLWYLRVTGKGGWGRIFFTRLKDGTIMLLNGFAKKDNKIPKRYIRTAQQLMKLARQEDAYA